MTPHQKELREKGYLPKDVELPTWMKNWIKRR